MTGAFAYGLGLLAMASLTTLALAAEPDPDCARVMTTQSLKSATGLEWFQGSETHRAKDTRLSCFLSSAGKPGTPGAWLDIRSEFDPERDHWRTYRNNYQGPHEPASRFDADAFFINQKTGAWILVTRGDGLTYAVGMVMPTWTEAQVKAYIGGISRDLALLPPAENGRTLRIASLVAVVASVALLLGLFIRRTRRAEAT